MHAFGEPTSSVLPSSWLCHLDVASVSVEVLWFQKFPTVLGSVSHLPALVTPSDLPLLPVPVVNQHLPKLGVSIGSSVRSSR